MWYSLGFQPQVSDNIFLRPEGARDVKQMGLLLPRPFRHARQAKVKTYCFYSIYSHTLPARNDVGATLVVAQSGRRATTRVAPTLLRSRFTIHTWFFWWYFILIKQLITFLAWRACLKGRSMINSICFTSRAPSGRKIILSLTWGSNPKLYHIAALRHNLPPKSVIIRINRFQPLIEACHRLPKRMNSHDF